MSRPVHGDRYRNVRREERTIERQRNIYSAVALGSQDARVVD